MIAILKRIKRLIGNACHCVCFSDRSAIGFSTKKGKSSGNCKLWPWISFKKSEIRWCRMMHKRIDCTLLEILKRGCGTTAVSVTALLSLSAQSWYFCKLLRTLTESDLITGKLQCNFKSWDTFCRLFIERAVACCSWLIIGHCCKKCKKWKQFAYFFETLTPREREVVNRKSSKSSKLQI